MANVAVALVLIGSASAYGYVHWRLDQVKRVPVAGLFSSGTGSQTGAGSPAPFTMLIIGSDSRALTGPGNAQFGPASETTGQRSDSIILVHVVPKTRSLALFSIPRDTLVPIPGMGTTRVNAAFNSGNPTLLVQVLQQDFGIEVNHVAQFNFDTFEAIATAIGGVYQWFPTPARDQFSNLGVNAGCQLLSGAQALAFARSREYQYFLDGSWNYQVSPESDLGRIQRQQAFVKAAVKKAEQVAPTDPITLNNVVAGLTKNVMLDSGFSNSLILSLAEDFHSAGLSDVPSFTYPTTNSTAQPGALDPDTSAGQAMIHQWLTVGEVSAPAAPPRSAAPPTTTVSPSSVSIEVTNGSGVSGQATQASSDLHGLGYSAAIGSSSQYGQTTNVIDYAPDSLAAAQQLQSQLVNGATLTEDSDLTPTTYNLELVTGQNYTGVKGGSTTNTSTSATSTTASPSASTATAAPANGTTAVVDPGAATFYQFRYIPPGRVPGQIPQTCPS